VVEEIFFRGLLYRCLRNRLAVLPAALIAGCLFGLVHITGYPLVTLPVKAALGLNACLLYEQTGSILPGIALHSLVDGTAFEAALTGHLVFSTLDTRDATGTINRIRSASPPHQQKLVHRDRLIVFHSFRKIISLQQARDRVARRQLDDALGAKLDGPLGVEQDLRPLRVEDLDGLLERIGRGDVVVRHAVGIEVRHLVAAQEVASSDLDGVYVHLAGGDVDENLAGQRFVLPWTAMLPEPLAWTDAENGNPVWAYDTIAARLAPFGISIDHYWTFVVPETFERPEDLYAWRAFGYTEDEVPAFDEVRDTLELIFDRYGSAEGVSVPHSRFLWTAQVPK